MVFHKVTPAQLGREKEFSYFCEQAPCSFSMCVELDVTEFCVRVKEAGVQFFPSFLHCLSAEVNESCVILITNKLSMFPISFYQGNPEVACLTLPRPDREERERMLEKVESGFDVKMKPGETLMTSDKKNEFVDVFADIAAPMRE